MEPLDLLKNELYLNERSLQKSIQMFADGVIDEKLHMIHKNNLNRLIQQYKRAIYLIENDNEKQINWQTPILEIIQDEKFKQFLKERLRFWRSFEAPPGKKLDSQYSRCIVRYDEESLLRCYLAILLKKSDLPSYDRNFIKSLVEEACVFTLNYYQKEQSKQVTK